MLSGPTDIALDSSGRLFIADTQNDRVRVVTPDGVIHRFAGGSGAGYSGDGGLAVDAALVKPEGLAIGPDGSVFIADRGNRVIRRVDTDGVISTVAGNGQVRPYNNPEPTQLSALQLNSPSYVAVAADGTLYVSERSSLGRVWRIDTDGSVTPVIHANMQALALDGTPIELEAIEATGLALLADGSLVVGDERDPYVLRLAPDGGLSVLAGNAGQRSVGDSMPAAQTGINGPQGIAIGSDGTLYVALACCQGSVVSIDPNGIQHILVVRRGHRDGSTVDTKLYSVDALAVTGDGSMYVGGFHEFWHSTPRGYAMYIARNRRIPPESGPADQLSPRALAVAPNGSVYAADAYQLYRLKTDGSLDWVAGTSNYLGSEGPIEGAASDVALAGIGGLAVAADGSLLIAQRARNVLLRLRSDGQIVRVAGAPSMKAGNDGDGGSALDARLSAPTGLVVASDGSILVADSGNDRVRRIRPDGHIEAFAGTGVGGDRGDGTLALQAQLLQPSALALGTDGTLYVLDQGNHRVRAITTDGRIRPFAGQSLNEQDAPGGAVALRYPMSIAVQPDGNLVVADTGHNLLRRLRRDGAVQTIAGTGLRKSLGDGGPVALASLAAPFSIAIAADGRLVLAEQDITNPSSHGSLIREISTDGRIEKLLSTTWRIQAVAFDQHGQLYASAAASGETNDVYAVLRLEASGEFATLLRSVWPPESKALLGEASQIRAPAGLAFSPDGSLYIADAGNNRVVRMEPDGALDVVAGTGLLGFAGDGAPASSARLRRPMAVAIGRDGTLFIADTLNHRVRQVLSDGSISTIWGTGSAGDSGEGGPPLDAQLNRPLSLAVLDDGSLYVADAGNSRVQVLHR